MFGVLKLDAQDTEISDVIIMYATFEQQYGRSFSLLPHHGLLDYAIENIIHPEDYRKIIQYDMKMRQLGRRVSLLQQLLSKGILTPELVTEIIQILRSQKCFYDYCWHLLIQNYLHLIDEETIKDIIKTTVLGNLNNAGTGRLQIPKSHTLCRYIISTGNEKGSRTQNTIARIHL